MQKLIIYALGGHVFHSYHWKISKQEVYMLRVSKYEKVLPIHSPSTFAQNDIVKIDNHNIVAVSVTEEEWNNFLGEELGGSPDAKKAFVATLQTNEVEELTIGEMLGETHGAEVHGGDN